MKKYLFFFLCTVVFLVSCGPAKSGNQASSEAQPSASTVSASSAESTTAAPVAASQAETTSAPDAGQSADTKKADSFSWESVPLSIHDIRFAIPENARKSVPKLKPDQFPREDGSTATLPLSKALYQISTGASVEEADQAIVHTKTTSSYYQLLNGNNDLVIAYEPSDQFYTDLKKSNVKLNIQPIGKDALVFLMNEGNSVRSLTDAQLRDIYSGKISNWSSLGGSNQEIIAFQRPENSGSQNLMEKLVMKNTPMAKAPEGWIEGEMGDLIDSVASYNNSKNALGYSVYFYARNMYEQPGLGFMNVNGIVPNNDTIRSGSYPYVNEFYAAIRADAPADSAQYRLFSWLTGNDGQALIESLGYVSIQKTDYAQNTISSEKFPGRLHLDSGKALAMDGEKVLDTPGTLLLSDSAENMNFIKDYVLQDCSEYGQAMVNINEPQIVHKKIKDGWDTGVRDIKNGSWLIEPRYSEISLHENGIYEAAYYKPAVEGELQDLYSRDGKKIAETASGETAVIGSDYIWIGNDDKGSIRILDLSGKQVQTLRLPESFDYFNIVPDGNGFCLLHVTDKNDRSGTFLYRENGELFYDVSMIPNDILNSIDSDQSPIKIRNFLPGGRIACLTVLKSGLDREGTDYLYDIPNKKLLTSGEELLFGEKYCLVRPSAGEPYVIGENGEPVRSASGKPFTDLVPGTNALIRQEKNTIWFSDSDHDRAYVLQGDFGTSPEVEYEPVPNLIMISNYTNEDDYSGYMFHGNDLLLGGKGVRAGSGEGGPYAYNENTDEFVRADYDSPYYFQEKDDIKRCSLENGSVGIQIEGNSYSVIDQNEHTVVKMLVSADD